ncbi:putative LigA [Burkholderia cenocepacia]|nr:putative LigA [Burkholderia cenocepacia]
MGTRYRAVSCGRACRAAARRRDGRGERGRPARDPALHAGPAPDVFRATAVLRARRRRCARPAVGDAASRRAGVRHVAGPTHAAHRGACAAGRSAGRRVARWRAARRARDRIRYTPPQSRERRRARGRRRCADDRGRAELRQLREVHPGPQADLRRAGRRRVRRAGRVGCAGRRGSRAARAGRYVLRREREHVRGGGRGARRGRVASRRDAGLRARRRRAHADDARFQRQPVLQHARQPAARSARGVAVRRFRQRRSAVCRRARGDRVGRARRRVVRRRAARGALSCAGSAAHAGGAAVPVVGGRARAAVRGDGDGVERGGGNGRGGTVRGRAGIGARMAVAADREDRRRSACDPVVPFRAGGRRRIACVRSRPASDVAHRAARQRRASDSQLHAVRCAGRRALPDHREARRARIGMAARSRTGRHDARRADAARPLHIRCRESAAGRARVGRHRHHADGRDAAPGTGRWHAVAPRRVRAWRTRSGRPAVRGGTGAQRGRRCTRVASLVRQSSSRRLGRAGRPDRHRATEAGFVVRRLRLLPVRAVGVHARPVRRAARAERAGRTHPLRGVRAVERVAQCDPRGCRARGGKRAGRVPAHGARSCVDTRRRHAARIRGRAARGRAGRMPLGFVRHVRDARAVRRDRLRANARCAGRTRLRAAVRRAARARRDGAARAGSLTHLRHAAAEGLLRKKRAQLLLFSDAVRIDDSVNRFDKGAHHETARHGPPGPVEFLRRAQQQGARDRPRERQLHAAAVRGDPACAAGRRGDLRRRASGRRSDRDDAGFLSEWPVSR